jgi:N-acetylglucosaminyldiphosphoundecaprenol N-acetyl-beta-D-mannosaminyltransferase
MLFCNINFNILHKSELFILPQDKELLPKFVITVNAEFISFANQNKRFMEILNNNYVTFDGMTPYKKAEKKLRRRDFEKLSGSDIIYDFCQYAKENNLKIFLLGSAEDTNRIATMKIREKYSIDVSGFSPTYEEYPFSDDFCKVVIKEIKKFKPDILFVGFGMPKQEYWCDDNRHLLKGFGVKYVVGCGGAIDFVAGKIKRAPQFIQRIGLETLYRIVKDFPDLRRVKRTLSALKYSKYIKCKPDFI